MHRLSITAAVVAFGFAASAFGQSISNVSPSQAALGATITIQGTGFGTAKPSVYLASGASTKKTALKVTSFSDTQIQAVLTAGTAGTFDVHVKNKAGDASDASALTLMAPSIANFANASAAVGATQTVNGSFFGPNAGKLTIAGKPAKVTSWSDTAISFLVGTNLPNGGADVGIATKLGTATAASAFTVTGSTVKLGKDGMTATAGNVAFKSSTKTLGGNLVVAGGQTELQGSFGTNPNYNITMTFPFGKNTPTPATFTSNTFGALMNYTKTTLAGFVPTIHIFTSSFSNDLNITVQSYSGGQIKGTFSGTVTNAQGEPPVTITNGQFVVTLKEQ